MGGPVDRLERILQQCVLLLILFVAFSRRPDLELQTPPVRLDDPEAPVGAVAVFKDGGIIQEKIGKGRSE